MQVVFFKGSLIREIRLSVLADCPSLLFLGVNSDYLQCTHNTTLGPFVTAQTLACGCTAMAEEIIDGPSNDPILRCIPKFNFTTTTVLSTTFSMRSSTTSSGSDSAAPGTAGNRGGEYTGPIVAALLVALLIFSLLALILVQRCVRIWSSPLLNIKERENGEWERQRAREIRGGERALEREKARNYVHGHMQAIDTIARIILYSCIEI